MMELMIKLRELRKQLRKTMDYPVPPELVGALYLITDRGGNTYYLATHGVQAKDADSEDAHWQKWFSPSSVEEHGAVKRAGAMLTFIETNGGKKISFSK